MAEGEKKSNCGQAQKRLEELLLDDAEQGSSGIDENVRSVGVKSTNRLNSYFIVVILGLLAFGAGYLYLQNVAAPQTAVVQQQYFVSPKIPIPTRPEKTAETVAAVTNIAEPVETQTKTKPAVPPVVEQPVTLYSVLVGPLITTAEVSQTVKQLQQLGFQPEKIRGRGFVTMIRLLEGEYSEKVARVHLKRLKQHVDSPFLLPAGDKLAVFAGSFHQEERAQRLQRDLAEQQIAVDLVPGDVEMNGTLLNVLQADQQTAREVAEHLSKIGLKTNIVEKK